MRLKLIIGCLCLASSLTTQITYSQDDKKSLFGNVFGSDVEVTHDDFEGTTTYTMTGNKVKIDGMVGSSIAKGVLGLMSRDLKVSIVTFRLQLERHITATDSSELAVILKVSVRDDAAFYPMEGESLIFLADGERLGLSTEGEYNAQRFMGRENNSVVFARYPVTQNQLEQILNAKEVKFRLMQGHYMSGNTETRDKQDSMEGEFSNKNFKAWQDFYDDYILKTPEVN